MKILTENKQAIFFLVVFVATYVVLNTLYGLFIEAYAPGVDPVTLLVTRNATFLLQIFDSTINYSVNPTLNFVTVVNSQHVAISVFEGCNGINVMIVFVAFQVAFKGAPKKNLKFIAIGLLIIYAINLARVALLYGVESHLPQYLYFFHKYFFTAILYGVVFGLWYKWVTMVKQEHVNA